MLQPPNSAKRDKAMAAITAIYVRVSTTGQNEAGQKREVGRWLRGNGIENARFYVDKRTGDNLDRPAFRQLQADVFNGEVGTIVVWKLDRLSRSMRDGINTLCEWCDRGLRVVSVTQQIDFNGTVGKMIASVLFAVAEMEQEARRERQRAGIDVAKEEGKYKGRQKGTTKARPQRARALRDRGLTLEEIATSLGVSRMTVCRYLRA
jgi:DNA invertase Pin-like site-specific DNA recombinase